ncbi:DUF4191 domain-containing protein [Rhodococcus sp. X156]|uniref:DUF4191 domain-containing protein n=1 Tax=Rhodococcus sp. X156 TaxID=2499145 RepID=UPI000FD71A4C|nr:DUF4191 domain-containing protein [Rhodococcus sp. X156]
MAKGKPDKAAKAEARRVRKQASKERRGQMWQAFQMQRKEDKALLPILVGTVVLTTLVLFGLGYLIGIQWLTLPFGLVMGVLIAFVVFGRRLQRSVYTKAEGQPGAAGWALENMRGAWRVKSAVAATTQFDAVHRVVGRPGVILVAEGAPHRVKGLLAQEKKKVARLVGDTPIYDIVVGNEEGQVPLSKLQRHVAKLPRNIDTKRMDTIDSRLSALSSRGGGPAIPKGPNPAGAKIRNPQRTARRR